MKVWRRILSFCLALLMIVSFYMNTSIDVFASGAPSNSGDYQPMSDKYAKAFIGFIYDKSEVTDAMLSKGDIYKFLTGGFEKGTEEELVAKIIFLATAQINLSKCTGKYTSMMDNSYDRLLEYFEKKAGASVDDGIANAALNKIIQSVAQVIVTYSGVGGSEIWEDVEFIMSTYKSVKGLPGKIKSVKKDVTALVSTFAYAWSSSRINMYKYLDTYIANKSCGDLLSDYGIGDLIGDVNNINRIELAASGLYDPILNWASDDHIAVLEYFGDFIYEVSVSLEKDLSTDNTQNVKVVEVHCPTDVYLYDENDSLLLTVIDDIVTRYSDNVYALVLNSQKTIVVPATVNYNIKIVGSDSGTMDYQVTEYSDNSFMRTVKYENVPLEKDMEYTAEVPKEIYDNAENYNLNKDNGEEITYTFDSQPNIETDIVDVVVAEELFEGFSTELIEKVAKAMFNLESSVDVSSYQISTDNIVALISAIQKYYPTEYTALTISDFSYKAIVSPTLDIVTKLRFYYGSDVNLSVVQKRAQDMKIEINKIVAQTEGMDDFEKALFVHDYILLHSEYDLELLDYMENNGGIIVGSEYYNEKYSEYSILVNGTGVCGSYALAYRAVLNAAGMECLYLSSQSMKHAWNMVKVGGAWYHVDCCWDDPVPDTYGRARRTYFLRTDDEIMQLNHRNWTPGQYKAASSKYSDMPRSNDIYQKYDYGADLWYSLNGSTLYTYDKYGNNENKICDISATSISVNNGHIYYSLGRYVYEYESKNQTKKIVYFIPKYKAGEKPENAVILNMYINENTIEYYKSIVSENRTKTVKEQDQLEKKKYAQISGIKFEQTELSVNVFNSEQLNVQLLTAGEGETIDEIELVWHSSDENIVKVDQSGNIKALNNGSTVITVSLGQFFAYCTVQVESELLTGMCGENTVWLFDTDTKTLTISGTGDMQTEKHPWADYYKEVKHIIVEDGVTNICDNAFANCENAVDVRISNTVQKINQKAFCNCRSLKKIVIPDSVISISTRIFYKCDSLELIIICNPECNIPYSVLGRTDNVYIAGIENSTAQEYAETHNKDFVCLDEHCSAEIRNCIPIIDEKDGYTGDIICPQCNTVLKYGQIQHSSDMNHDGYCDDCNADILNKTAIVLTSAYNWPQHWIKGATYDITLAIDIYIPYDDVNFCISKLNPIPKNVIVNLYMNNHDIKFIYQCSAGDISVNFDDSYPSSNKNWGMITNDGELNIIGNGNIVTYLCNYDVKYYAQCDSAVGRVSTIVNNGKLYINNTNLYSYNSSIARSKEGQFITTIDVYMDAFLYSATIYNAGSVTADTSTIECGVMMSGISEGINSYHYALAYGIYGGQVELKNCEINADAYSGAVYGSSICREGNHMVEFAVGVYSNDATILDSNINTTTKVWQNQNNYDNWGRNGINQSLSVGVLYTGSNYPMLNSNVNINSKCVGIVNGETVTVPGSAKWSQASVLNYTDFSMDDQAAYVSRTAFPVAGMNDMLEATIGAQDSETIYSRKTWFGSQEEDWIGPFQNEINCAPVNSFYYLLDKSGSLYQVYTGDENGINGAYGFTSNTFEKLIEANMVGGFTPNGICMHNKTKICNQKEASCVKTGYTGDVYCLGCDGLIEQGTEIQKKDKHNYKLASTFNGNCTTPPSETYVCSECGDTYTKTLTADLGHDYTETTIAPTCTEKGYTKAVCSICGEVSLYDFTAPTGHNLSICKSSDNCSAHGTLLYSCSKCDYEEYVAVDASNLETKTVVVPATCTLPGLSKEVCTLCGATISSKVLAAKGHMYSDEYTVDKASDCTSDGSKSRHCTVCGAKGYVTVIPAAGHKEAEAVTENLINVSCTENGSYDSVGYCSDCGKELSRESITVPANGHSFKDGVCENCGAKEPGYINPDCSHFCHSDNKLVKMIYRIFRFFWKLFGIKQYCSCGAAHY